MRFLSNSLLTLTCIALLTGCVKREDMDALELKVYEQDQQIQQLNQKLGRTTKELEATRPEQADMWSDVQSMRPRLARIESSLEEVQHGSMQAEEDISGMKKEVSYLKQMASYLEANQRVMASQMAIELPEPPAANAPAATGAAPAAGSSDSPMFGPAGSPAPGTAAATTQPAPVQAAPAQPAPTDPNVIVAKDGTELVINPGKPAAAKTAPAAATAAPAAKAQVEPAVTEKQLYDAAFTAFKDRRYKDALRMWEQFEKTYPKHSLVPNAIFWQGETNYQLKEYAPAILAYQKVIDKYSKSDKYRSAMLKQGIAFGKLGKNQAGRVRLEELIKKFPKTQEAERAKKALAEMK
ncbi:tol-pal system protein YbgF [Desulfovibrio subterraneus]|uniref:Tol-pal system protein YbgF n=1 Tax=Desulfovibrio subterraneus TaxID=2718620 RepID=A0A7J0BKE9_9BACT|nr:tol-pal system protein YbgF [Desulfovibrio subterraneus]GFM34176.1 tol-pal system protein YbgF [Desulfovibrio subterraneus]